MRSAGSQSESAKRHSYRRALQFCVAKKRRTMKNPHPSENASWPDKGLRVKRLAGTVIGGARRIGCFCPDLDLPTCGRSSSMRIGKEWTQGIGQQGPVTVGTALKSPHNILRGDGDGIGVVSKDRENRMLRIAEEVDIAQPLFRARAEVAARLDVARERSGNRKLQSPDKNKSMLV
jgi:regulator of RNase E activity RraA